jgi:hypothetical protein
MSFMALMLGVPSVAVQVECESKLLNQDIAFQVQGLKPGGFELWVNCVQLVRPHRSSSLGSTPCGKQNALTCSMGIFSPGRSDTSCPV